MRDPAVFPADEDEFIEMDPELPPFGTSHVSRHARESGWGQGAAACGRPLRLVWSAGSSACAACSSRLTSPCPCCLRRLQGHRCAGYRPSAHLPFRLPIPPSRQFGIPLERRVGTSYEDAVFKDEVDPEATEWWFTEPAGARALVGCSSRSAAGPPRPLVNWSTLRHILRPAGSTLVDGRPTEQRRLRTPASVTWQ